MEMRRTLQSRKLRPQFSKYLPQKSSTQLTELYATRNNASYISIVVNLLV